MLRGFGTAFCSIEVFLVTHSVIFFGLLLAFFFFLTHKRKHKHRHKHTYIYVNLIILSISKKKKNWCCFLRFRFFLFFFFFCSWTLCWCFFFFCVLSSKLVETASVQIHYCSFPPYHRALGEGRLCNGVVPREATRLRAQRQGGNTRHWEVWQTTANKKKGEKTACWERIRRIDAAVKLHILVKIEKMCTSVRFTWVSRWCYSCLLC